MTTKPTTAQFLQMVVGDPAPGERVELRAFSPSGQRRQEFFTTCAAAAQRADALRSTHHVYYSVGRRKGERGTKAATTRVATAWVDQDFKVYAAGMSGAEAALAAFRMPPSIVVATGTGFHPYWLLTSPVLPALFSRLEALNRGLARGLSPEGRPLDAAVDASRVLRLPGSLNHKHTPPRPVRVIGWHPERRYRLEDLEATLPAIPPSAGKAERVSTGKAISGVPEGARDLTLFQLACRLRQAGVPRDVCERLVLEAAAKCAPPFPPQEALTKVASAWRYPTGTTTIRVTTSIQIAAGTEVAELGEELWR